MHTTGIICEYDPLHLGHKKQLDLVRARNGAAGGIVCLMSGNFVQRGRPAIIDKALRAKAAVLSGADLVLELPVTVSASSAEGFAAGGVAILAAFCDELCFGAENADKDALLAAARGLLSPDFSPALKAELEKGGSFPAAREKALEKIGVSAALLRGPNNILAVEYCKAILSQNAAMDILPIHRAGCYHDTAPDPENPSATAVRGLMRAGQPYEDFIPAEARDCCRGATLHTLEAGERAILARLRTMSDADFAALPYGSEGLWRKLMHAARQEATLEAILTAVKSKRYTRSRLDRMVMCALLGLTREVLEAPVPYVRVLAFNDRGREILKEARKKGLFPNVGEKQDSSYQALEQRADDLYGLFALDAPEAPGQTDKRRVYYHHNI